MPYARTSYTLQEIETMIHGNVNVSVSTGGGGTASPNPHAKIHAPTDELHRNPLFQRGRVSSGDVGTHSVVRDKEQLKHSLMKGLNSAPIQAHLEKRDPKGPRAGPPGAHPNHGASITARNTAAARNPVPQKDHIWVNINFAAPQGLVDEHSSGVGGVSTRQFRFQCLGVKLMVNPRNHDIPILQTCVPMEHTKAGMDSITVA